jgi:ATP-dependent DNA helicase RecQ
LNEEGHNQVPLFRQILQSWALLSKIKVDSNALSASFKKDYCVLKCKDLDRLERLIKARRKLSEFIVAKLLQKIGGNKKGEVEFSSNQLKVSYPSDKLTLEAYHHTFVYLHDMLKGFELRRGRLIYYQTLEKPCSISCKYTKV